MQSQRANALLLALRAEAGAPDGSCSKSHSRGLVAVALGGTEPVGIDVEFMAPGRPIGAIVQFLLKAPGPPAFDDARAYRAWTFAEAHFKAFGALPEPGLLQIVLRAEARWGEEYAPQPGMRALHSAPASDFTMSVVWAGDGAPEAVSL